MMYSKTEIQTTASWINFFFYYSGPIHFAVLSKHWPI